MYYKIKVNRLLGFINGKDDRVVETYLTDASNFAEAGYKVIQKIGVGDNVEVEDIMLMKNLKPLVNEKYSINNKLFIVKVAEDIFENNKIRTVKYVLPAFANNSDELQRIMNDYISQGLENMRLTTISETQWIYLE